MPGIGAQTEARKGNLIDGGLMAGYSGIVVDFPVAACGMVLYFKVVSRTAQSKNVASMFECRKAQPAASMNVFLKRSATNCPVVGMAS